MSIHVTVRDIEDEEQQILADALQRYQDYKESVDALVRRLAQGDTSEFKELMPQLRELRKATDFLLDERAKLNERRRKDAGNRCTIEIDFDEARATIGGRLDSLRKARCPKGLLK